jgi:hypothetical protein
VRAFSRNQRNVLGIPVELAEIVASFQLCTLWPSASNLDNFICLAYSLSPSSGNEGQIAGALEAAVAEKRVLEDVQADVVPEALPAMLLNEEMAAKKKHLIPGSAAEAISVRKLNSNFLASL